MIKNALIKKLEGEIEVAKADLKTFLEKPIGVAEHIDYVATAEKKLEQLAHASEKLDFLKNLEQCMKAPLEDLKEFIREQELLTRRLIVKNSRKNDYHSVKKQLSQLEKKEKLEQNLRNNYPAVKEAYKHYKLTMALVNKK